MDKIYRWGILGAGRIAEKFCTAINFTGRSEVYAIASRDIGNAKLFAEKYNAKKWYNTYEDLAHDEKVDIIYIATPHVFHYEQSMLCLENKKAVVCEKPMSLSHRQTAAMIASATANNVFFMEGLWTACMPFLDTIRRLVNEGNIGEIKYVDADFGFAAPEDPAGRLYNKSLGGGALLDIGIYPVSLATIFLGNPSAIKSVSELSATGVDEYVNMVFSYHGGKTAHVFCTITFNTPVEARITGTKGHIRIQNPWFKATNFSLHSDDGTMQTFAIPHRCNGFEYEIEEVVHCLDNGLLQSNKVPHDLSLSTSRIMDEVLLQAGVAY